MRRGHVRRWALVALVAAVAVAAGSWAVIGGGDGSAPPAASSAEGSGTAPADGAGRIPAGGRLLMRELDRRAPRASGALYEVSARGARRIAGLKCKQVHAGSTGAGLCLAPASDGSSYAGIVFDERYHATARFAVEGVPDRARVSRDGRLGAYTTFVQSGSQGYFASTADFATQTRIVEMASGRELVRLEDVEVTRDGKPFDPSDEQLWGVTFGEGGRYYATLATGSEHYLIEGDVESRTAKVLREGVECPSLSPDGRRIAYKSRIGNTNRWRLHVLDLDSGRDTALAERRSIDDQPEWLGDDMIVYSDERSVMVVPADGAGAPEMVASGAFSPAFLGT